VGGRDSMRAAQGLRKAASRLPRPRNPDRSDAPASVHCCEEVGDNMVRYQRLGRVELNVRDLERSRGFYKNIVGLQPVLDLDDVSAAAFRCGSDDCTVVLHEAAAPGFRSMAIMLDDDAAVDALLRRLRQHDIAFEEVPNDECARRGLERMLRMAEPNMSAAIEFCVAPVSSAPHFVPTVAKIQRLGHVVFGTPRYSETVAFMQEVLGFEPSDDIEGVISFMRPPPNPYHHGIGVGRAPHHGLHHVNFMVSEIDDIGTAINRFKHHNVPIVFGPGRHIASNSVFLYFLDPDGLTLEYSYGMEEFAEHSPRPPRTLPPVPQSIDSWGGIRDPRMSAVGLVQPYSVGRGWLTRGAA
jgi:2,3-dihydroxy-p-cumate/2,3-dihydroxybenzoate 3,4-dioxygenase